MAARGVLAGLLYLTTVTSTHIHHPLPRPPYGSASDITAKMGSIQPLQVDLSAGPNNSSVACTIRNNDPEHTISFLTWDTPFDPTAVNTGVLTLKDTATGDEIPSPGMKINRQMPPPRDDLQEIAPKSSADRQLNLSSPWIPTDGKKYLIGVQGSWRAVWTKPASSVTDDELAAARGDEAMQGSFHSESVEMELN